jgi:hypothetical protein
MMAYGEVEILCHLFLTSILSESLGSSLCHFNPGEKNIKYCLGLKLGEGKFRYFGKENPFTLSGIVEQNPILSEA